MVALAKKQILGIALIDREISRMPEVEAPANCRFTPGLMSREIFMPAGGAFRSKIHKTEHQYIVSQGSCFVSENGGPKFLLNAPFHGLTKPGTWRTLFIITDCIWTTFHPTEKTSVEEVEPDIIKPLEDFLK